MNQQCIENHQESTSSSIQFDNIDQEYLHRALSFASKKKKQPPLIKTMQTAWIGEYEAARKSTTSAAFQRQRSGVSPPNATSFCQLDQSAVRGSFFQEDTAAVFNSGSREKQHRTTSRKANQRWNPRASS
ncbi:hypothetical protein Nepgr_032598 [Nepenthes gracilis]|uniref:Uncharacterized protein n=1 Tax=Nepenthes gracilis TaxID=150966 RepID=A0AAD3TIX1_NEPGR|nr:hypothetical protein Nepgr_032598 [Nepenthes gracilis]